MYHVLKTPAIVQKTFPNYVWKINTDQKIVYLTFDDGPTQDVTEKVLDILNEYNAKATFFCIGKNINQNPDIFQRILKEKHAIGNHTNDHIKGWKTSTESYLQNVKVGQDVIDDFDSKNLKLFRPPYGRIKPSQSKQLRKQGYHIVMWDVLSYDWDENFTKEKVANNVLDNASKGSIIVFHDSIKASKNMLYALPKTLAYFSKKGFQFDSLDVLLN